MTYLFVAYTIVWLGIFAYTYTVGQQAKRLGAQVEALEGTLSSGREAASPKASGGVGRK